MSLPIVCHVSDKVEGAIYIGRAMPRRGLKASPLANPHKIGVDGDRRTVIAHFEVSLMRELRAHDPAVVEALIAVRQAPAISCWCRRLGEPWTEANACHGEVIVGLLERFTDGELRGMPMTDVPS